MKKAMIIVRIDGDQKTRIEAAARAAGMSVTNVVLEGTMKKVEQIERRTSKAQMSTGHVPAQFRMSCETAKSGGSQGYRMVGYSLVRGLPHQCPDVLEEDEWFDQLRELENIFLNHGSDEAVCAWFDENLPQYMAHVPARRRQSFIDGMRECCKQEGIEI